MPKSKKRKRPSLKEQHKEESEARYSSLIAIASKSIRKEAKVVKSFECQKIVRKIKALKSQSNEESLKADDGKEQDKKITGSKFEQRLEALEQKLKLVKDFNLDSLVRVCFDRLGLDVSQIQEKGKSKGKSENPLADSTKLPEDSKSETEPKFEQNLIESMLLHQRLVTATSTLNEKIAEYNKWHARRTEWLSSKGFHGREHRKKSSGASSTNGGIDMAGHDGNAGLFIDSLSANRSSGALEMENVEEIDNYFNHESNDGNIDTSDFQYDENIQPKKKNRMGQRQRKAKAMAIEARRSGKEWDASVNWREKKKTKEKSSNQNHATSKPESASGLDLTKKVAAEDIVTMGKDWKDEGKAHPSWAARQTQKLKDGMGIVEFKGKKITFD